MSIAEDSITVIGVEELLLVSMRRGILPTIPLTSVTYLPAQVGFKSQRKEKKGWGLTVRIQRQKPRLLLLVGLEVD